MLYSLFSHSGFTNDIILTPSLANNTYLITFSPTYPCFLCSHIFYFWYYVGSSGLARDYCYSYLGAGDFARSTPQNVPSTLLHIPVKFGCYSQHTFLPPVKSSYFCRCCLSTIFFSCLYFYLVTSHNVLIPQPSQWPNSLQPLYGQIRVSNLEGAAYFCIETSSEHIFVCLFACFVLFYDNICCLFQVWIFLSHFCSLRKTWLLANIIVLAMLAC